MANETAAEAASKPKPKLKKAANGGKGARLLAHIRKMQKEGWEPFLRKGHHGHFYPIDLDKI